jgi:RNA polymerase sporulation-specific sigma factor
VPLILGEVRRWLRDNQAIHLPRRLQERGSLLAAAADRWAQQHGREPTVRDLADALGWDVATVVETMDSRRPPLSWEGAEPDEDMSWGERVGTAPAEGEWVSRIVVEDMLRALGPRGHALVFRRFVLGESQAAVAARLGLSQAQVSRLERRTLLRLRQLWTLATTDAAPHQRADHRTH